MSETAKEGPAEVTVGTGTTSEGTSKLSAPELKAGQIGKFPEL